MQNAAPTLPQTTAVPRIGAVNWMGVATLCAKEIQRFFKVGLQTVVAPAITTLLFMAIFLVAIGGSGRYAGPVPFAEFLAPGLVMMAIIQNSFANTSSSLLISKVQGNIVDVLMPPLSELELTFAFAVGGVARGAAVAIAVTVPMFLFVSLEARHLWAIVYFGLSAALMLSLMGILTGIWAQKFDHNATVTNFLIMPLSFLSGTFYSIERLPGIWQTLSQFNPFFYMIDGYRYGFTGHADGSLAVGVIVIAGLNLVLWLACHALFKSGYNLKA
ncbi:MAG: ABC transporter permease [Sphingomonadales bacterium]